MQNHGILVYMECADGQPIKASLEALNAAGRLAAQTGKHVAAVLLDQADAASAVAAYGVETVLCAQVGGYQAESYAAALAELCGRYEADALLMGSTRDGKELAARVAVRLGGGCVTDANGLSEQDGAPVWTRSVYGGSLVESVKADGMAVVTIRSGSFGKPEMAEGRTAEVLEETVAAAEVRAVIRDTVKELSEMVNLEDAEVIVAGGRGMGSAENFALVKELAELLGGVVGASRPAIEEGWVPRNHQVGQSGKIVAPKLYIACGISGAMQHVSGMSGSGYIVAINKDEDAPIFDVADVGIVGNVMDILPLMIEEVKARKS